MELVVYADTDLNILLPQAGRPTVCPICIYRQPYFYSKEELALVIFILLAVNLIEI